MQRHSQPYTLFGISLKGIITTLIFLVTLLAIFDQLDMESMFSETISFIQNKQKNDSQPGQEDTLVATPGMVSNAISEIRANKKLAHEQTDTVSQTDRFFYIVELYNGGDIEASDVTIEPEMVTILSKSGIETVIPRTTIKRIRRYKLPDPVQPQ